MNTARDIDNRSQDTMYDWLESTVKALRRRVKELEQENRELKAQLDWRDIPKNAALIERIR